MKLVGCRHCGNLVVADERRCPFCGGAVAEPSRLTFAACAVFAGLVLGGCAAKVDTPITGDSDSADEGGTETDANEPVPDLPNSEATYGVPGTDSDWYSTESDGDDTTTGDLPSSEATYGVPGTDSDWWSTDSDGETDIGTDTDVATDTDTDTDGPSTATDSASSDAG